MIARRHAPPTPFGCLEQPPALIPLNRLPIPMIALGLDGDLGYADLACARCWPGIRTSHRAPASPPCAVRVTPSTPATPGPPGLTSATHARQRPDPLVCIADVSDSVLVRSMTRTEGSSVQYATRTGP